MAIDKTSPTWVQIATAAAFAVVIVALGALSGTAGAGGDSAWFQSLDKPVFNPPSWVFGPVWTVLYVLMGIAAFLVLREGLDRRDVRLALGLFVVQLGLNLTWTPVFFGAQELGWALVVIVAMLIAIAATIWRFFAVRRLAGWLLMPYIAWVSFATVLNASLWAMN